MKRKQKTVAARQSDKLPWPIEVEAMRRCRPWVRGRLFRRFWKRRNEKKFKQAIKDWTPEHRIGRAKEIIKRLTYEMDVMLQRKATNDIVVYSDTVASQVPKSNAAYAFNQLRDDLHAYAVIRLLAVWDPPDFNSLAIPAAIALLDDDDVIRTLEQGLHDDWAYVKPSNLSRSEDPEEQVILDELVAKAHAQHAVERSEKNTVLVRQALDDAKTIMRDKVTERLKNLRHFKSHSIEHLRGRPGEKPEMPKYTDENAVLGATVKIVELLYSTVNGTSYDLSGEVRDQTEYRAKEFWGNLKLVLPDRIPLWRPSKATKKHRTDD